MNRLPLRTRIAPTPSGFLHIGNLCSFVLTWLIAREKGGTLRLRIDDLDAARMRTAYLEDIFKTLDFIGILPDEGPSGVEDFLRNHSQLHRMGEYMDLLNRLKSAGHLYACCCSRSRVLAQNPSGIYPGTCRNLGIEFDPGAVAWRVALPQTGPIKIQDFITREPKEVDLSKVMGDFVVLRKDGLPAYQVASLVDDLLYGINTVVRGDDLFASTAAQLQLAQLSGIESFSHMAWHHHHLVKNNQQQKLSKSSGDTSVGSMLAGGIKKEQMIAIIALFLALPEKPFKSLTDLQQAWEERQFFNASGHFTPILNKN